MIEPREPSRFLMPPVNVAARRMSLPAAMSSGYAGVPASGATSESLLIIAWRGRWTIFLCAILALVAGFVYIQTATAIYTSTSRICLDYMNIVLPGPETGRLLQTERYLQTQADLLRSRSTWAAAVTALEPQRLQTFRDLNVPEASVDENLLVEVGRKSDVIKVSFSSPYSVEAAQVVNAVVQAYMDSRSDREQRNAAQVLKILREDLARTSKELAEKQTELETFRKNHMPLSLGSDAGGGIMQKYLGMQADLAGAQIVTIKAEGFLNTVKVLSSSPDALRQYLRLKGNPGNSIIEAERSTLEAQRAGIDRDVQEMLERVTAAHPAVVNLLNQRAAIDAALQEMDKTLVDTILVVAEQSYTEAMDYERQLSLGLDELKEQVTQMTAETAAYQRLQSDVGRLEAYRQTVEDQVREIARIINEEDVGQLRMTMLEEALPADHPSQPQKGKVLALALVLGLLAGGGISSARAWFDQTLRSTDEIPSLFGVPALGVVPAMSRHQKITARGQQVFRQPDSHEAEAIRTIRTAVFFGAPLERARSILVTSPSAGDGKSTLVSNLGIAMAVAGQKTIILDADLRKPTQHLIFEVDPHGPSVEDVMGGTVRLADAIRPTKVKGLSLLMCRGGLPNPAEILNSPRFGKLLHVLKTNFGRVLIDAPPVNVVTDAQILAAACDCTILVLKTDKTTRRMVHRAVDALRSVDAHILGVVLNQVSRNGDRYGYYQYGRYKRAYGSGSNGEKDKARGTPTDRKDRGRITGILSKAGG